MLSTNKFVRLNKTVNSKGDLIPYSENFLVTNELRDKLQESKDSDWYTSVYYYGPEAKTHYDKNNNSIADYTGKALTNKLIFDFDKKDEVEKAKEEVRTLLNFLSKQGVDVVTSTNVFFSGHKGFHVEVLINKELTPSELKVICTNIAKELNLTTFDPKIYNTTRLIRIPNTKHQVTSLYKIQLEPKQLKNLTIEQIKALAAKPSTLIIPNSSYNVSNLLQQYNKVVKVATPVVVSENSEEENGIRGLKEVDFNKCPAYVPRCIHALTKGIMVPGGMSPIGGRSNILFRLATFYRNQGMDKDVAYNALKGVARLNANLYPEATPISKDELWKQHIASAYASKSTKPGGFGTSSDNELFQPYCDAVGKYTNRKCVLHEAKAVDQLHKIEDVAKDFQFFAENFDSNSVKTGIDFIDDTVSIVAGTTTLIVGAAGCGKTTLALNILENSNNLNQHCVMFSMDTHKNFVYLKLAMKLTGYSKEEILDFYRTKDYNKINEIKNLIAKNYKTTFFDFSSTLNLEQMRDRIFKIEQENDCKINLVLVDYAGRISGPYSDSHANANFNALKTVEVANDTNAAWIILSQISRQSGDGSSPLRTKRVAKDSGSWEESCSNQINLWRPFLGANSSDPLMEDNVVRLYIAKNRMGQEIEAPLHWNGAKGTITDMTPEELEMYNNIDKRIEKEKEVQKAKRGIFA